MFVNCLGWWEIIILGGEKLSRSLIDELQTRYLRLQFGCAYSIKLNAHVACKLLREFLTHLTANRSCDSLCSSQVGEVGYFECGEERDGFLGDVEGASAGGC